MLETAVNRSELRLRFEVPEAYVGYEVYDPEGRRIGSVKGLFTNAWDEPEYIRVRMGIFGLKTFLIPTTFVAVDEKRQTLTLQ